MRNNVYTVDVINNHMNLRLPKVKDAFRMGKTWIIP